VSFPAQAYLDRLAGMRILLSNDDGILAPGLAALREAVEGLGDITVVAPETPQSATGHGITLKNPLTVQRVQVAGAVQFEGTSVDGSPADCVRLAIRRLMPHKPELVLAGINAGANVGINVFYSGTVAAAAEAVMLGVPAVAFSAAIGAKEVDFARAGRLCRWLLERLLACGLAEGELINVNIPPLDGGPLRGVRVVAQSTAGVEDVYHPHRHEDGKEAYRLGEEYAFVEHPPESDVEALANGYVTVTPLHVDMTRHERLGALSGCDWSNIPT